MMLPFLSFTTVICLALSLGTGLAATAPPHIHLARRSEKQLRVRGLDRETSKFLAKTQQGSTPSIFEQRLTAGKHDETYK